VSNFPSAVTTVEAPTLIAGGNSRSTLTSPKAFATEINPIAKVKTKIRTVDRPGFISNLFDKRNRTLQKSQSCMEGKPCGEAGRKSLWRDPHFTQNCLTHVALLAMNLRSS
jgi:hypothetical protein